MENGSIGKRGMGINYKGSQGQTKRAVVLQEEEDNRPVGLSGGVENTYKN
jgi:hypothetical protein